MNGYIYIYRPDHPNALKTKTSEGYIAEHRVVLEDKLGRLLSVAEDCHHINGVRDDNRPENLVALTRSQHRSQHAKGQKLTAQTRKRLSESMKRVWETRRTNHE